MNSTTQEAINLSSATEDRKLITPKRGPGLVIEYAFALVIAAMMFSIGAAFCIKFLRWAL